MTEGLTTTEAAERLGVPPTTLVTWLDELPIPQSRDDGGRAWLDEDALAVLEAVRGMRAYDLGFQTIRRHLEALDEDAAAPADGGEAATGLAPVASEAVEPAPHAPSAPVADPVGVDPAAIAEAVTRALAPLLETLADLNGAQARELMAQARQLGQLEADNAFVRRDRDRLATELLDARRRVEWLETRLDAVTAAPRPWWRFWA